MVSRISSLGLFGLNAFSVDVEVDICRGQPHFEIVGLPEFGTCRCEEERHHA